MLKKSIKHFLVLLMSALLSLGAIASSNDINIYVDNNYPPFSFSDKKQAKGMYIDVLNAAFSKMKGFKINIIPIPWKRGKSLMAKGEGFALAPAFFHAHDWEYLYPYSLPFYTETIIVACNANVMTHPRANWPNDYKGLTIGNISGFDGWGGKKFRALVEKSEINYAEIKSSTTLVKMLINKRHDCILIEDKVFQYLVKQETLTNPIIKGAIIGKDPVYIGYSEKYLQNGKQPNQYEFRKQFDSTIYKMKKSGEIDKIMNAYQ